jgi:hypothetical protein
VNSPFGLVLCAALVLPLAAGGKAGCVAEVVEQAGRAAVRGVKGGGDDAARAAGRAAQKASGYADDASRGAVQAGRRVSQAAWSRLSNSMDDAVAATSRTQQALTSAASRMSPKAFAFLRQKYEKNEAALQSEINRANSGYQSDAECAQATARIQKLAKEQAAIEKLVAEMG